MNDTAKQTVALRIMRVATALQLAAIEMMDDATDDKTALSAMSAALLEGDNVVRAAKRISPS